MKCPSCSSKRIRTLDIRGCRYVCFECRHQFYDTGAIAAEPVAEPVASVEPVPELREEDANSGVTPERIDGNLSRKNLRKMRKGH